MGLFGASSYNYVPLALKWNIATLGLVLVARTGLIRQVICRAKVLRLRLGLLTLGRGGTLGSWMRMQLQLHALLSLEVQRQLASNKVPTPPPPPSWLWVKIFGGGPPDPKLMANPMDSTPVVKDIVLVGGGHSHVHVLKMFGMRAQPGVRLTLITRDVQTPYSGMLPGYVAGMYTRDECHIDLPRLAAFANARLVHAEACGIDVANKRVLLAGRPPLAYDVLSMDIGSAPQPVPSKPADKAAAAATGEITPVKPIDGFCARWDAIVERVLGRGDAGGAPVRLVVVGGGAGGVELALAIQARLRAGLRERGRDPSGVRVALVSRAAQLMPQHSEGVRRVFARVMAERGVELLLGKAVETTTPTALHCADGETIAYDEAIWCTQGRAQPWLKETGLALDAAGFIAVHPTLESTNAAGVFAAGDVAAVLEHPRPKAGVFAVRQGPPLAANLRRLALGEPLVPFVPQSSFLGLIGTGDGLCVASRGALALEAPWLWQLKDWIDRTWMAGYSTHLPEMEEEAPPTSLAAKAAGGEALDALTKTSMRCGGCGAKVGATVLSRVMERIREQGHVHGGPDGAVLLGLDAPDDCAVLAPTQLASVHTVDFFRSFISDPFVFGRVAANHALSDCHAMVAQPVGALAIAVVPYGLEAQVEETLFQMMAGACVQLHEAGCALLGGHTCEGMELSLGFCITGRAAPERLLRKGGLVAGQALLLTKPIGTGALFAAHMRRAAEGGWVAAALRGMVLSNDAAAKCLLRHGATSCTDVTGFGLLGHLIEMAKASNARVAVKLDAVPLLPGALECVKRGIFSSLQPANLRLKRAVSNEAAALQHAAYPLLFDPQTAGGLLSTVPADRADECVAALRSLGYEAAAVIGRVTELLPDDDGACALTLVDIELD